MSSARMTGHGSERCEDARQATINPEDAIDYASLLTGQLLARPLPPAKGPDAEGRYWRNQIEPPRPGMRLVVSIATTAGVILMLLGIATA